MTTVTAGSTVVRHEPAQPDGRLLVATVSLGASGPTAIAAIPTTVWLEPAPAAPLRSDAIVAGEILNGQPLLGYTDWLDDLGVNGNGVPDECQPPPPRRATGRVGG